MLLKATTLMENNDLSRDILPEVQDSENEGGALNGLVGEEERFESHFSDMVTPAAVCSKEEDWTFYLPSMFRWVAMLGAAAIFALLAMAWYGNSSIDADAVAGISGLSIDDAFADNLFEK